nr:PE family protein [Mycobacterium tuberculosis]
MSFVVTAPPVLASAASDLGGIASMISEANAMAAVRTTALAPAAADEVFGGDRGAVFQLRAGLSNAERPYLLVTSARDLIDNPLPMPHDGHHVAGIFT